MPRQILGLSLTTLISRIATAAFYGFITLFVFYELPNLLLKNVGGNLAGLPIENQSLFISYAILITSLSSLQIIFQGKYLGDAAAVGNGVAQIFYIYIFTNGGIINEFVASAGVNLSLDFRTVLYLMMVPSALSIVSAITGAAARSSVQRSQMIEEIVLN
ncbi:MAG: hypothetical protein OK457_08925 [Thaumarchaeota archaeon]|nr:hypothetical protein [Nitrososphaerota archaeon]